MQNIDPDEYHAEPREKRANRWAIVGLLVTFLLAFWGGYYQAHPWDRGNTPVHQSWYPPVQIQGQQWNPTGGAKLMNPKELTRVAMTSDNRPVFQLVGGGGGEGERTLYLQLQSGYYLPLRAAAAKK